MCTCHSLFHALLTHQSKVHMHTYVAETIILHESKSCFSPSLFPLHQVPALFIVCVSSKPVCVHIPICPSPSAPPPTPLPSIPPLCPPLHPPPWPLHSQSSCWRWQRKTFVLLWTTSSLEKTVGPLVLLSTLCSVHRRQRRGWSSLHQPMPTIPRT